MIKLHGVCASPYVRKALVALELKGLDFESIPVFPVNVPDEFTNVSPLKKIPAMEDGDLALADSSVICEYLEDAYPEVAVYPSEPKAKARARWLEEYADSKLVELASIIFYERVLKKILKQETDEARVNKIIEEGLPPELDYLECVVPKEGFLFGERLMVADAALVTHFINAEYADYHIEAERWPKFAAYFERVKSHPVMAGRIAEDSALFEVME